MAAKYNQNNGTAKFDNASSSAAGNGAAIVPERLRSGTIPALDGFRAIAIIFVMLSHIGLEWLFPGQFGVTLFFFLSGYLITTLLRREFLKTGRVSLRGFYLRRVVRIIPPMYLAIMLAVVFSLTGVIHELRYDGLIYDFLFLSNYFPESGIPIGLWSLAVEEHFYLLFPALAALFLLRRDAKGCAAFCAMLCVIGLGIRLYEVDRGAELELINFWTHTRLDSILFGAILAMWNNPVIDPVDRLPSTFPSYLIGGLILLSTFVIRDEVFRQTLRYSLQGIGLIFVFNAAIRDERLAPLFLDTAIMRFVALLSYTLYLVHVVFIYAFHPLIPALGQFGAGLIAIAASFAFSYGVYLWMEKPLGAWRKTAERNLRERGSL
jgi:peptidoglycan/LPS O-acetylase OafA/YrhL